MGYTSESYKNHSFSIRVDPPPRRVTKMKIAELLRLPLRRGVTERVPALFNFTQVASTVKKQTVEPEFPRRRKV